VQVGARQLRGERIGTVVSENADATCRVITDEYTYRRALQPLTGGHDFVTHRYGEYVKRGTDIHSNTIEGVFSLLKRGVMGTFHTVSKKHLPNYLNEFEFRYNTRRLTDGERLTRAIKQVDGKPLKYRGISGLPAVSHHSARADRSNVGGPMSNLKTLLRIGGIVVVFLG
jgi:transposase-like protein